MRKVFLFTSIVVLAGCTTTTPMVHAPSASATTISAAAAQATPSPENTLAACVQVVSGLQTLNFAASNPLLTARGTPFEELYDECDATDTFAGQELSSKYTCSSNPNNVSFISKFSDGTIVFNAKMSVDGDGSPASMGPNRSPTDQPETWLTFDGGSERRFVNAEDVPFVVVPVGNGDIKFQTATGIKKGDLAVAVHKNRCSFGVVGDAGPYFRLGEASIRTHGDLGNPQCAVQGQYPCQKLVGGGSGRGISSDVTYIIFPGTRPTPLLSQSAVEVAGSAARDRALEFVRDNAK